MCEIIWFDRAGNKYDGQGRFEKFSEDRAQYTARQTCMRCGGLGGSEAWKFTGWTCYRCGGNCTDPKPLVVKLYTAEKLAKLVSTQSKRDAKRKTKAEQKRIALRQEALAARRANADVSRLIGLAWPLRKTIPFFNDVIKTALKLGRVSDKQLAAVLKVIDARNKRLESEFLGTEGSSTHATIKITSRKCVGYRQSYAGYSEEAIMLTTFEDESGNILKTFNKVPPDFYDIVNGERELSDKFYPARFTVKKHETYKGVKSTIIQRIKVVETE